MRNALFGLLAAITATLAGVAGVIAFGTARPLPELGSISAPFKSVDFSDVPPVERLAVQQGSPVAFRTYGTSARGVVIAIHGSSAQGPSLHPFAKVLAAEGYVVLTPDLRGHGETGQRGDVDFLGQPDADLAALIAHARGRFPGKPISLVGFSLGGGFVLHFIGAHPEITLERAVLVSPALGRGAATARDDGDQWAAPHLPRIIALIMLNRIGIHAFDGLEAITYAVPPNSETRQVSAYSFRLLMSLVPADYRASIAQRRVPIAVVIGGADEVFDAEKTRSAFFAADPSIGVTIVPDVNHVGATLDPAAISAILKALARPGA